MPVRVRLSPPDTPRGRTAFGAERKHVTLLSDFRSPPETVIRATYRGDVTSGVVHTVVGTAANEADINQMAAVLHGREQAVFADAGYTGADKRPELEYYRSEDVAARVLDITGG